MVTITNRAREELKRIVEMKGLDPGKFLRLATPPIWEGEGDFGIVIDEERHEDQVVDFQGSVVLLVDPSLEEQLPKAVLDFKESPGGSRFTLDVF